jgi:type I restriction enzyme, S subunit
MNKQINKLIPEIRFPEFANDGEWEEEELGNCLDYLQPTHYLVDSTAYENRFKTPVLTAGKTFILGYTNEEYGVFSEKLPVIIFDDFTTASKYVNFPFKAKSSAMKILLSKKDKDIKFVFELMQMIGYEVGAHERHWISKFSKIKIKVPKILEQQKIASCLSSLDEVITAHTNKLETLKTYKKGLMQNLFPQEGEKVPKLRFKEFEKDGEWLEDKLGDIGNPSMCKRIFKEETTSNPINGIPFYKIGTFGKETDSYISKEIYEEYKRKYSFPKKGDILISASGTIGRLVVYNGKPAFFQDSNIVWIDNDESKTTNNFLFYVYSLLNWQTSDGGIIQRLYNADLKGMIIRYPKNQQEQQKIADTLSSLDDLIKVQDNKIKELKLHKKGLMQGLFPKMKN